MKKITLLLVLVFTSLQFSAQENEEEKKYAQDINKKDEIKLNALSLIVLSSIDVSYERLLNKDSSFGFSVFYNFNDVNADLYYPKKLSLTPYYRWFFSESTFARGFFVEGFGMLNTYEDLQYDYNNNANNRVESETNFALGVSVGGKFVTTPGFTTEVYLGVGRNMINNNNNDDFLDTNIIARFGISLGYRF